MATTANQEHARRVWVRLTQGRAGTQAKFVKTAERAQVRAHEGSVRHVAPSAIRGMSRCRHCLPSRLVSGVTARFRRAAP